MPNWETVIFEIAYSGKTLKSKNIKSPISIQGWMQSLQILYKYERNLYINLYEEESVPVLYKEDLRLLFLYEEGH